jgi:hypothetical protein
MRSSSPGLSFEAADSIVLRNPFMAILPTVTAKCKKTDTVDNKKLYHGDIDVSFTTFNWKLINLDFKIKLNEV